MLEQYENEESRFLQQYKILKSKEYVTVSIKRSAVAELDKAKYKWKTFVSGAEFSMSKCRELVEDNDPATIIKSIEDKMKRIVEKKGRIYPLELIRFDKFVESEMPNYIVGYAEEMKARFELLFEGKDTALVDSIAKEAKQATYESNKGMDVENYKTLQILVDSLNELAVDSQPRF